MISCIKKIATTNKQKQKQLYINSEQTKNITMKNRDHARKIIGYELINSKRFKICNYEMVYVYFMRGVYTSTKTNICMHVYMY